MYFLQEFKDSEGPKILELFEVLRRNWSSQEQVYYKLAPEKWNLVLEHKLELEIDISEKPLRKLDAKEKFNFWLYLRLIKLLELEISSEISFWIESTLSSLERLLSGSELLKSILPLPENYFRCWIEDYFFQKKKKRIFFSTLYGTKKIGEEKLSLYQRILRGDFDVKVRFRSTKKPKKTQFRKGYRDHGSLGSDLSRINREASWDVWFQQRLQQLEQDRKDSLQFLMEFIE